MATPTKCITSADLAEEAQLPRSAGGALGRAELLADDSMAREAHETLRKKHNQLVADFRRC